MHAAYYMHGVAASAGGCFCRGGGRALRRGTDGLIPCIGENGNWWLGDTDTGVKASVKGDKGDPR